MVRKFSRSLYGGDDEDEHERRIKVERARLNPLATRGTPANPCARSNGMIPSSACIYLTVTQHGCFRLDEMSGFFLHLHRFPTLGAAPFASILQEESCFPISTQPLNRSWIVGSTFLNHFPERNSSPRQLADGRSPAFNPRPPRSQ